MLFKDICIIYINIECSEDEERLYLVSGKTFISTYLGYATDVLVALWAGLNHGFFIVMQFYE